MALSRGVGLGAGVRVAEKVGERLVAVGGSPVGWSVGEESGVDGLVKGTKGRA